MSMATATERRGLAGVSLVLVLALAAALRFAYPDAYPDWVHHDHTMFGRYARDLTLSKLAQRPYSVGGPMMACTTFFLWVFGAHLWVLRLTAACAGVAIVGGVYALGSAVFSRRVGLIAAALAATQNVLLLYSRLPYIIEPLAPMLWGLWCGVRGWQTRRWPWWVGSGLLSGFALWGYWSSLMTVPMYAAAACVLALTRFDECWARRWYLALWAICFVAASSLPWTDWNFTTGVVQDTLRGDAGHWTAADWLHQLQHGYGALVYYSDAGGWRAWTSRPMLLPPDIAVIALGLFAFRHPRGRVFLGLCWLWVLLITLLGGVMLRPANFYHLLGALPFLVLLAAVGIERLRWRPLIVACVVALMWLHVDVVWRAVAPTSALATAAAARWISNHRDLSCITLMRRATDQDFRNGPLYAFVRDVKVIDNDPTALKCSAVIIFPGVPLPVLPPGHMESLPSLEGPVLVWRPQEDVAAVAQMGEPRVGR
jgi:4-amino-4-deoxy-L-arabinose transferase-like glycosyltransferase